MAFNGYYFSFNGKSCEDFNSMIYDFKSYTQDEASTIYSVDINEDRLPNKYNSIHYGLSNNKPLKFTLVFGVDLCESAPAVPLDRTEIEEIAKWLTCVDGYKWLEIDQPDLEGVRYKCVISELKLITEGWEPWAFSCEVSCDSQYAYSPLLETTIAPNSSLVIENNSSYVGYYYPKVEITMNSTSERTVSIKNISDGNREMRFAEVPTGVNKIYIDCDKGIITNSADLNIYPNFNFNFLRLKQGDNQIKVDGDCAVKIIYEFPVLVGA